MDILLATTNPHKAQEIAKIIPPELANISSLKDFNLHESIAAPEEDQETFEGNAILKARYYADKTGKLTMADDSGLEVDALDGKPGVHSARYSGAKGPRDIVDQANNKLLLKNLNGVAKEKHTARFVCTIALCDPQKEQPLAVVRGTVEGLIITPEQASDQGHPEKGIGYNGFGYDPLFFLPQRGCTTAQLSPEEKNAISHRGAAARKMAEQIKLMMDDAKSQQEFCS